MEITLDNWNGSHCKEEVYHINSSERLLEILDKLFESKYILSKEIAFKCAVKCLTMGCIPQNDLDLFWEKY